MTNLEFADEVYNSYKRSTIILEKKASEYASDNDRLIQFHEVAKLSNGNPCEALIGMAAKHFTSIMQMVKDPYLFSIEQWDEKVTDLRNYTFLLDALLRDMGVK